MFCNKCGKQNPDDAVYCQKCGALLETEEETRVAERTGGMPDYLPPRLRNAVAGPDQVGALDADPTIFSISPTLKFVKAGYVGTALGALVLVALLTVLAPSIPWWIEVAIGFALFLIPAFCHFRQKLIKYSLTDTTVEIDSGLLSRNTRNVPIRRIQDVTVSATMWQRMLGFGDVVIDNASEQGGKVVLKNIDSPRHYADMLLRQMRLLDK
ncbi:MAG: PH domain-containing protein [Acidobacteriota bacterium]